MQRALFGLLAILPACHQPREMAPQTPLAGIDGKYTFTISNAWFRMEGQLLIAYSQAHVLAPRSCVPIEGPKSSEEMRASWFECRGSGSRSESSLRLRFSEVDPIRQSRWYARMHVQDTVVRCTSYQSTGDCVSILRARGMKWVDRNGSITVVRGFPAAPDTGTATPSGDIKRLRARCDTSATSASCTKSRGEGQR